MHMEFWLLIAK